MEKIVEILKNVLQIEEVESCNNFIEEGLLDSLDVMELVETIEEEFKIEMSGRDIIPENFTNVQTIANLVKKYGVEV